MAKTIVSAQKRRVFCSSVIMRSKNRGGIYIDDDEPDNEGVTYSDE